MNIVFVHGHLHVGGIETLILKLARELDRSGHRVTVIAGPDGNADLEGQLRKHADVYRQPTSFLRGYTKRSSAVLGRTDVFYSFGSGQLVFAELLRNRHAPAARLLTGVYCPWEYFPPGGARRHDWELTDRLFAALPDENIIFMSEACKWEHVGAMSRSFALSPVIPLPIDIGTPVEEPGNSEKIVSIGRVVDYKPYTFHMLDVIAGLRQRGHALSYHVYGDGSALDQLRCTVREKGLKSVVHLHGTLDYSRLRDVLQGCMLFVGVGTAALEAGALGVPTLVAYESREPLSLGYLHETVESEVGDVLSRGTRYPLIDKVAEFLAMSVHERRELGLKARIHASAFASSAVAARYAQAFSNAKDFEFRLGARQYVQSLASALMWKMRSLAGRAHPDANRYEKRITPSSAVRAH